MSLSAIFQSKVEKVIYASAESEYTESSAAFLSSSAKININGKSLTTEEFGKLSKNQLTFTDKKVEWKVLLATDESAQDVQSELGTVGFYYVLSAKSSAAFEHHRVGSASLDKDGKVVDLKMTLIIKNAM